MSAADAAKVQKKKNRKVSLDHRGNNDIMIMWWQRKHEGGGEGDAQNGQKKAKKKSKKKDKEKEKVLNTTICTYIRAGMKVKN